MQLQVDELVLELESIGAIKFGEFKLKSGIMSPVYFDLRVIVSYPKLLDAVADVMLKEMEQVARSDSLVCGVPYTALPIATIVSVKKNLGMVVRRKEVKDYGTKKMVEGRWEAGQDCIILEDVITSGGSVRETADLLREHNMKVTTCVVLLDREQGGRQNLTKAGIQVISIFPISRVLDVLLSNNRISSATVHAVQEFIKNNQTQGSKASEGKPVPCPTDLSFQERSQAASNPVNKKLFDIMIRKKSNLCVAVDKTKSSQVIQLVQQIGKCVAVIKLHADIIEDWSRDTQERLAQLARDMDFLIFEDRKLADIGNTVKHQVSRISPWSDLLTVQGLPGPGLLEGVRQGRVEGRDLGVLMVAEMSNSGNLFTSTYTKEVVSMGEKNEDIVSGFISQSRVSKVPGMIQMTPGVQLTDAATSDSTGDQRYTSPSAAVLEKGADLVIVGRGICASDAPAQQAEVYRQQAWQAYLSRVKENN